MKNSISTNYFVLFILAILLSSFQIYLGVSYSYDSNWYLLFSESIRNLSLERRVEYAPLISWTLGLIKLLGFHGVNAIFIYWLFLYFSILCLFQLYLRNIWLTFFSVGAILTNELYYRSIQYLWTEFGYSVILAAAVSSLLLIIVGKNERISSPIFFLAIAFLPLQRYIGSYISLYLAIIFLLWSPSNVYLKSICKLSLSFLPILIVMYWNFLISGHYSGPRSPSLVPSYIDNLVIAFNVLRSYMWPYWILFIGAVMYQISQAMRDFSKEKIFVLLILLTPFIQFFVQIYANSTYDIDKIHEPRYHIVLIPTLLFMSLLFIKFSVKSGIKYIWLILLAIIGFNLYIFKASTPFYSAENFIKEDRYIDVKKILSEIPPSVIYIYAQNGSVMSAEIILDGKILPDTYCKSYRAKGSIIGDHFSYVHDCFNGLPGHLYQPIKFGNQIKQGLTLVWKQGLPDNWRDNVIPKDLLYSEKEFTSFYVINATR